MAIKNQYPRLRILSFVVILYMLSAFFWWSLLLYQKNRDVFDLEVEKLQQELEFKGRKIQVEKTARYLILREEYGRQKNMIVGEGIVIGITLLLGFWLMNKGYFKEMRSARQQHNFLLSITHELKSPIASVKLILETFKKHKALKETQVERLTESGLKETDRLHQLVNDLLLAAKMETAYKPYFESVDLNSFLDELFKKFQMTYPAGKFHLHFQGNTNTLYADKYSLRAMTSNLLENAVKYSGNDLQIDVTISSKKETVILDFSDCGQGIPDREKKYIFQKFYRIGDEDTRKTKGTGLGLYIVHHAVKLHKGTIQVLDNKPQGTIFRIELPKNIREQ